MRNFDCTNVFGSRSLPISVLRGRKSVSRTSGRVDASTCFSSIANSTNWVELIAAARLFNATMGTLLEEMDKMAHFKGEFTKVKREQEFAAAYLDAWDELSVSSAGFGHIPLCRLYFVDEARNGAYVVHIADFLSKLAGRAS